MATKKTTQNTKSSGGRTSPKTNTLSKSKQSSGGSKSEVQSEKRTKKPNTQGEIQQPPEKKKQDPDGMLHQLIMCMLFILAVVFCVFLAVSSNEAAGVVGGFIRSCAYGLFGYGAWLIPVSFVICALRWKKCVSDGNVVSLFVINFVAVSVLSAMLHAICVADSALVYNPVTLFSGVGGSITHGGVIGGLISNVLMSSIQKIATYILLGFFSVLFCIFALGLTPRMIWLYIRYQYAISKERAAQREEEQEKGWREREEERRRRPDPEPEPTPEPTSPELKKKKKSKRGDLLDGDDLPQGADDGSEEPKPKPFEINMFTGNDDEDKGEDETLDPVIPHHEELTPIDELDLEKILLAPVRADEVPEPSVDDNALEVSYDGDGEGGAEVEKEPGTEPLETTSEEIGSGLSDDDSEPEPQPIKIKPPYRFPPMSLLTHATPINDAGAQEELQQNARKLVDTLLSFKVKTKILSVSRGPTITRYELSPEAGTRVRSIANLVDDIALNLATSGVRIEAPIPGKSAVGIEVPNKTVATVRLRELVDSSSFKNAESKLNVALGVDVAGSPVYCNLAKMPHMLIAGATGMGKSVCINSIISSILYKATPDEVKLILVDPKKVEFNIYNGLPHLLVPVVSDPQKAAGSLNWAVGEMERRFTKIDEVGVRDIAGYNEIIKGNPDYEPMPYVVIIIDELADLMMTAKDTVETSICRLAQKARAAGMHLVIGTQRPSVDVITGLIKANIPSRIAFTVASQVDSKTIIDIGGAEKLIGRGDMLYAPVGFMKPLRVQGSFVSDEEVRAITDFIRNTMGKTEYDSDIIYSIEREAERCVQSSKGGGGSELDDDELRENVDPKFREALEVAVNSGKISTSLLQRHLSIGYGRAAKIIDRMQALGYVTPPDGTKPREVLITKQMYMEKVINNEEF